MDTKIENKYYTPNLEELCIGLECEYSTLCNTEGHNHFNWQLRDDVLEGTMDTYLLKTVITDIVEEGYEMPVRVKYLDIEDIESLDVNEISKQGGISALKLVLNEQ